VSARKIFAVIALALLNIGCGAARQPVVVRPSPEQLSEEICFEVSDESRADAVTFFNTSDGVASDQYVVQGSYSFRTLVRDQGPNWILQVDPVCTFGVGPPFFGPGKKTLAGFRIGQTYTVLYIPRTEYSNRYIPNPRVFTFTFQPRPDNVYRDELGVVRHISYGVRLPTTRKDRYLAEPTVRIEVGW
jgi:hypothetical protein